MQKNANLKELDFITICKMTLVTLKNDSFAAKCFIELILEQRKNIEDLKFFEELYNLFFEYKLKKIRQILENMIK